MKKSSLLASTLALTLAISSLTPTSAANATSKLTLSTKKVTLNVNKSTTVSANKKVTWKTSNKKIAQIKKLSNQKAKITAKKSGSCKITAIKGKTKAVIRVTVKKQKTTVTTTRPTTTVTPVTTPKEAVTTQPLKTLTPEEKEQLENAIPAPIPDITVTPVPTQDATVSIASASRIMLSVADCTTTGIKLTITNDNDTTIMFGENYSLQKIENGSWENVPYITDNWAFTAIGIGLPTNSSYKKSINWENFYGELSSGTYRIVKDFYENENRYNIACEFVIDETTPTKTPDSTPVPELSTATPFAFLAN